MTGTLTVAARRVTGRKLVLLVAALFLTTASVVSFATPAQAATATLVGNQQMNTVAHYNTARTNSNAQNFVSFRPTTVGNSGGYVVIGLRNSAGTQFAAGPAATLRQAVTIRNSGLNYVTAGTFYINARWVGACGGCDPGHWAGDLTYNVRYVP